MIGWLPHSTNPVYAGVRYRCLYPLRYLRGAGIGAEIYEPGRGGGYRTVVAQELLSLADAGKRVPTGAAIVEELGRLKAAGTRVVIDVCDNHFYHDRPNEAWLRANQVFREMVRLADLVVYSTAELARRVSQAAGANAPGVVIGDALEREEDVDDAGVLRRWLGPRRWRARLAAAAIRTQVAATRARGAANLVWFGSAGSSNASGGMDSLAAVADVLAEADRSIRPIALTVISNNRAKYEAMAGTWRFASRYLEWDRTSFMALMRAHDLCIIPIARNPFTVCKSNNRVLTALHCGLPVVADRIPSYADFAECTVLDDWMGGLGAYLTDPARAAADVARGRERVAACWSHETIGRQWSAALGP